MTNEYINAKEKLLIENIVTEATLLPKIFHILEPSYFSPPLDRVVGFINDYFKKYKNAPSFRNIKAETDVELNDQGSLDESDIQYTLDELENHCQQEAIKKAIMDSVDDVEKNNISAIDSRIRKAISVKVDNDIGLEYFEEDAESRLNEFEKSSDALTTGYRKLDDLVGGGIRRGDLIILAGSTGVGKSLCLSNIANNYSINKEDVLIVSLELDQELTAVRLDSIITGIPNKQIFQQSKDVQKALEYLREDRGSIVIKYMPFGSTPSQLQALLLEYQLKKGKYPDVLVLDYIDEMSTGTSKDNSIHEREGELTGEVRRICQEYNMRGITASQLVKDVDDITKLTKGSVSGSNAKTSRCDFCIGIIATEEDIDNNQIQLTQIKVRSGAKTSNNKTLFMNPHNIRITEEEMESSMSNPLDKLKQRSHNEGVEDDEDREEQAKKKLESMLRTI